MPCLSHVVKENNISPVRLDRYVSEILGILSRSQIKARQLKGKINGKNVKLSRIVKQGDNLELNWEDAPPFDLLPENIPLETIYEDVRCVVINKAQGMVVHPGAGNRQGTLANALYYRRLANGGKNANENIRPGIVHRLDKETSGVIVAAYDDEAHAFLAEQFKSRKTKKNYIAIVQGAPKEPKGKIETFLARDPKDRKKFAVSESGRSAITYYKTVKTWRIKNGAYYSLILLRPRTGRTHQLRVHLRHIGVPILGDPMYGSADKMFPKASLMLHSRKLAITIPGETEERIFSAPMPQRFKEIMEKL
ncbi:MAG: RluA family pseudouridine synthase [Treponema sp.]|nr:RluA family pseudouridine synthase [Treponema sp.]MCL2237289.1 RluA family pseudouridine synthase [Treponema sp.]